jgi:arginine decarboxylase-like protein
MLTLPDKAGVDELLDAIATRSRELAALHGVNLTENTHHHHQEHNAPVSMVHINLSVFRSAVDCWAINQVFPIMPLSKLDQAPDMHAVLADLTCDSDGKIDSFINPSGGAPLRSLPLHSSSTAKPYRLGMFLTGVYQETMGSNHNMFGALNSATIRVRSTATSQSSGQLQYDVVQIHAVENEEEFNNNSANNIIIGNTFAVHPVASSMSLCSEGGCVGGGTANNSECSSQLAGALNWNHLANNSNSVDNHISMRYRGNTKSTHNFVIENRVAGESVATVLSRAGHDADSMLRSMHSMAAEAVSSRHIDISEAEAAMQCVMSRLDGYTYMR